MRLDKKREEELARRKGSARKTMIQSVWLLITIVAAYFITTYLFAQGILTYDMLYIGLGLPRSIPEWALLAGTVLLIVIVMQVFLMFGFIFANPEGRRKLGDPTLTSRYKDPFDDK